MKTEELDAIKVREQAATPGPWWSPPQTNDGQNFVVAHDFTTQEVKPALAINIEVCSHDGDWKIDLDRQQADADFIANARTDVPMLIQALTDSERLLRETRRRLDEVLARFE